MSVGPRFRLRAFVTSAMALGLLLGSTPIAGAHGEPTEDPRAEVFDGNVDEGMKTPCDKAGLVGQPIDKSDVKTDVESGTYLTIYKVAPDVDVTGIVVKGGPGYNLYEPGEDGMAAEPVWDGLRSPVNNGGNVPTISHWFLCGTPDSPDTTPPGTTTPPVETTPPGETPPPETTPPEGTTPGSTPPGSTTPETTSTTDSRGPSSTPATTTTTSQEAVAAANDTDDLASTGFGQAWLLGAGALLLVGGGALVMLTRKRRTDG